MSKRRYAIYGGSFDPIHLGHIALAEHAAEECGLDKLIFMPAYVSPFKQDRRVTDGRTRYEMIETVLGRNKAFSLSSYEIERAEPSYTFDTLTHWSSLLDGELGFILGFDSLVQADTWYMGKEILHNYHLITARRPDTDDAEGMERIAYFRREFGARITLLEMEPVDASSTEIRRIASIGGSLEGMVPREVEEYIIEHDLYAD